jgi:hypothetical protein
MPEEFMPEELSTIVENHNSLLPNPFSSKSSYGEVFEIAKMLSVTQMIPEAYRKKPADCVVAIDMANRMGVSPMMVMQNLYVVRGKPSWSGQGCMALIKAHKDIDNARPVYFGERNTDGWGCYILATFKDGEKVHGAEVTIKMAKDEGWYGKNDSKWKTIPELMLSYRAAAFFARVYIPESLMGVHTDDENEDIYAKRSYAQKIETDEPDIFA